LRRTWRSNKPSNKYANQPEVLCGWRVLCGLKMEASDGTLLRPSGTYNIWVPSSAARISRRVNLAVGLRNALHVSTQIEIQYLDLYVRVGSRWSSRDRQQERRSCVDDGRARCHMQWALWDTRNSGRMH
jgi:hypothetical protein